MLNSSLCDYSDVYILVKGNIAITEDVGLQPVEIMHNLAARQTDKKDKAIARTVLHLLIM